MNWPKILSVGWTVVAFLGLVSCSATKEEPKKEKALPPVPDFLLAGGSDSGTGRPIGRGTKVSEVDFSKIEWTDPDQPDKPIPILDRLFREGTTDQWEVSFKRARELAIQKEKVLLLWFTDSDRSAICKRLKAEVWRSNEFKALAKDRLMLVRLDFNVTKGDQNTRIKKKKYLKKLKKEYRAMGLPTVVLLTPDGQFSHRELGCVKGQAEFYYQQLKFRVEQAEKQYQGEKERLRKKGYRYWKSPFLASDLFAKYIAHRDGVILLQRIDKERLKFKLSKLSKEDQKWVERRLQATR